MSHQNFADLGVSKPVVRALAARGIEKPFAVQKLVIADILAGHDVLAQSPTGSGKTLAFGIPLADMIDPESRRPAALVLAPTRELACQIVDEVQSICNERALSVAAVYGGVGLHAQAKRAARAHIVVATPGRLEDLLQRGAISLKHVRMLVLDEADRMLDMGFKPAVDRIVSKVSRESQTLFFSATLEGAVGRVAKAYTQNARRHAHRPAPERKAVVEHRFVHIDHQAKLGALVRELEHSDRGRTLVFVRTKRGADRLVKRLKAHERDRGRNARQQVAVTAPEGAGELRGRPRGHARGHRCRRPRHRRARRDPRDQLRRPRGSRRLRAPHRPHRPRGAQGDRRELRDGRPDARHAPHREGPGAHARVRRRAGAGVDSRARRASQWGMSPLRSP